MNTNTATPSTDTQDRSLTPEERLSILPIFLSTPDLIALSSGADAVLGVLIKEGIHEGALFDALYALSEESQSALDHRNPFVKQN